MNKAIKLVCTMLTVSVLASCSVISAQRDYVKKVDTTFLRLGMTKAEAQSALKKKPENIVAASKDPVTNAMLEVVEYSYPSDEYTRSRYLLFFSNDKLERWEQGRPNKTPIVHRFETTKP